MKKRLQIDNDILFQYGSLSFPVLNRITRIENSDGVNYKMEVNVHSGNGYADIILHGTESEIATTIKFLTGKKFASLLIDDVENATEKKIDDIAEPDDIQLTDPLKYIE